VTNKTALITGAGSGIGRAVAMAFLRAGFNVALAGRREEPLRETAQLAGTEPARALVVPTGAVRDAASNTPWVLLLRDGHAMRQDVKLGARSATEAEIREGLQPSSVVVISNVPPGTRVRANGGTRP